MNTPLNGLAAVLRPTLGAQWETLHEDIRARFTMAPTATRQSFTGTMQVIDRSAAGWLVAKLIAFVRILPCVRASNVPFAFNLSSAAPAAAGGWIKERLYDFADGVFAFRSVMSLHPRAGLIEQFPWGLGMKIRLVVGGEAGSTLYFLDDGYFLKVGSVRLPLPRWCTVGRFKLAHRNIDRDNFEVEINLDHPLLGQLFHQHGVFQQSIVSAMADAGCRDEAGSAACLPRAV